MVKRFVSSLPRLTLLSREKEFAAGPTGNRYGDAAGHACIAVSGPVEKVLTIETGQAGREANMRVFTRAALDLLATCLAEAAEK